MPPVSRVMSWRKDLRFSRPPPPVPGPSPPTPNSPSINDAEFFPLPSLLPPLSAQEERILDLEAENRKKDEIIRKLKLEAGEEKTMETRMQQQEKFTVSVMNHLRQLQLDKLDATLAERAKQKKKRPWKVAKRVGLVIGWVAGLLAAAKVVYDFKKEVGEDKTPKKLVPSRGIWTEEVMCGLTTIVTRHFNNTRTLHLEANMATDTFKPALIIVDLQEDFCPPNGSLAVQNGRDIVPFVNKLLDLPFVIRIATKDWHPNDHISFASNHASKQPFVDFITVINPSNLAETYETRLWPVHCVQNTKGAELVSELNVSKVDNVVEKGSRKEVEMYSAFYDPFVTPRVSDSGLSALLRSKGVTDIYVVGLAFDYCVKCTALDAVKEGFRTFVVEEGTKAVDPSTWEEVKSELKARGVEVVKLEGREIARLGKI